MRVRRLLRNYTLSFPGVNASLLSGLRFDLRPESEPLFKFTGLGDFVDEHASIMRRPKPEIIASDEVSESCEIDRSSGLTFRQARIGR